MVFYDIGASHGLFTLAALHYGGPRARAVLEKDLELFENVLALKEVLAGFRQVRTVEITERIGHRFCTAALWPTVQRSETEEKEAATNEHELDTDSDAVP